MPSETSDDIYTVTKTVLVPQRIQIVPSFWYLNFNFAEQVTDDPAKQTARIEYALVERDESGLLLHPDEASVVRKAIEGPIAYQLCGAVPGLVWPDMPITQQLGIAGKRLDETGPIVDALLAQLAAAQGATQPVTEPDAGIEDEGGI